MTAFFRKFVCVRRFLSLIFIASALFSRAQSCYFLTDTGSVAEPETSNSLVEFPDGTVYVVGTQGNGPYGADDMALLKFDACGNLLWTRYYGDTTANQFLYINKTYDNKLITIGTTGNSNSLNDILVQKIDTSGNIIFQKKYNPAANQSAKYIQQTSDSGYIFCGLIADSFGSNDTYIVKTDSAGTVQWTQQIGGNMNEYSDGIMETQDGCFVMTGDANSYGAGNYDIEVAKFDKNGNIIWDYTYGDALANGCQGILELSNGKYLVYGETNIPTSVAFDFFICIIDTNGYSTGLRTFGGQAADALFSLVEKPDHKLMCTGYSRSFNGLAAYDLVLFETDTLGNMSWLKNIYNPGIDIGYRIVPSINGDYLLTGLWANNNGDYLLIHSDTIANTDVGVEINYEAEAAVYPNPCADKLSITFPGGGAHETRADLINMLGESVATFRLAGSNAVIETGMLKPGIYSLLLKSGSGKIQVIKFVKGD